MKVNITEYSELGIGSVGGGYPVGQNPPSNAYDLEVTSESVRSPELQPNTILMRIIADDDCRVSFAPGKKTVLPGGEVEFFTVRPGAVKHIEVSTL